MSKTITILVFVGVFVIISAQFFNEDEINAENDNAPLFVPGKCPDNQLLYKVSEDENVDRVCDCGPGFIYYPPKDTCYEAFRQGPCKVKEYIALMKTTLSPACVKNPCNTDGMVSFKNRCYKLHNSNGCPMKKGVKGSLGVNATTLQLQCIYGDSAATNLNFITVTSCPPGSKRIATGQCRKPTNYA